LETEGIFRLAGNVLKVEELSRLFFASDLATVGGITPSTDIHVVAELLKKVIPFSHFLIHTKTTF
jgi:hypothetical protein